MQDELRELWNALDSTLNPVLTPEGENASNGIIRYVHHNVWIYTDDVDGFSLMTEGEAASLNNALEV